MHGIDWHITKHRVSKCHPLRITKKHTFSINDTKNNFIKAKGEVCICDRIGNDN